MSDDNATNEQKPDLFESVTDHSDTAEEFLQKLDLANDRWHEKGFWIFRGQNCAEWELMPSLFRCWDEDTRHDYEIMLIENFIRNMNLAHLPIPGNSLDYLTHATQGGISATQRSLTFTPSSQHHSQRSLFYDFTHVVFAIAQHSGVPTRLLDFTYDPLVAAYFAADWTGLLDSSEISPQRIGECFTDIFNKSRNSPNDFLKACAELSAKVSTRLTELPQEMAVWAISATSIQDTTLRFLDHPYTEILNLSAQKGIFLCETENYEVDGETWRSFNGKLSELVESGGIYKLTLPCTERLKLLDLLKKKRISELNLNPTYEIVAIAATAATTKHV